MLKPYLIQWQNTVHREKPWNDFTPRLKAVAGDEGQALRAVENQLRTSHYVVNGAPVRAIPITWDEYIGTKPKPKNKPKARRTMA